VPAGWEGIHTFDIGEPRSDPPPKPVPPETPFCCDVTGALSTY
jgi:hypothetical protein